MSNTLRTVPGPSVDQGQILYNPLNEKTFLKNGIWTFPSRRVTETTKNRIKLDNHQTIPKWDAEGNPIMYQLDPSSP